MEKRTKLGVAATSLAVAATMIGPTTASAEAGDIEVCLKCPSPGEDGFVFYKIDTAFNDLYYKLSIVPASEIFYKIEPEFDQLSQLFLKFREIGTVG